MRIALGFVTGVLFTNQIWLTVIAIRGRHNDGGE